MKIAIKALAFSLAMTASALTVAAADAQPNPDPWEPFNRKIFAFNDFLDRNFLKPVAKGYETVTPQFIEDGVHHLYSNVGEIGNFLNSLLQAKFKNAAESGGRFVLNSSIGLFGFFDVASKMGMLPHEEDFGQTLGYWGVHPGPYIVVPLLGPRTVRDGFGSVADGYSDPIPYAIEHVPTRNEVLGGRVIDTRVQLLKAEELVTGDRYIFIRDAYLQRRQFLIDDGAVKDSFGNDDFMYDDAGGQDKSEEGAQPVAEPQQEKEQPSSE